MDIVSGVLAVYIISLVIAGSKLMIPVKGLLSKYKAGLFVREILDCRLCTGFWMTLLIVLISNNTSLEDLFIIWGSSYFLATQER